MLDRSRTLDKHLFISFCYKSARYSAGGVLQGLLFPWNLGRLGNSVALWLNIEPYELFFYVFLPPLLLDAAVKLDFFLFKKVISLYHACGT